MGLSHCRHSYQRLEVLSILLINTYDEECCPFDLIARSIASSLARGLRRALGTSASFSDFIRGRALIGEEIGSFELNLTILSFLFLHG